LLTHLALENERSRPSLRVVLVEGEGENRVDAFLRRTEGGLKGEKSSTLPVELPTKF